MAEGQYTIRILHECQVWIDKSVPRVTFWHHEARRVMPNCDPRDRFVYPSGMDRQICPEGHILASRGSPSDAKLCPFVTRGTDLSIHT